MEWNPLRENNPTSMKNTCKCSIGQLCKNVLYTVFIGVSFTDKVGTGSLLISWCTHMLM